MHTTLLLALLACLAFANATYSESELQEMFTQFTIQYDKHYINRVIRAERYEIFKQNVVQIEQWKQESKAQGLKGMPGISKFTDMTREEFRSKMLLPGFSGVNLPCLGHPGSSDAVESDVFIGKRRESTSIQDVPDSFDWRDHGAVTPAKDQGSAGTCWAFGTVGNIEGQWFLKHKELISLSEEQLVDCDPFDCGVFGGWPCRAYEYIINVGGLVSEQEYPYCAGTGACYPCMAHGWNRTFCGPGPEYCNSTKYPCKAKKGDKFDATISDWKLFSSDEEELKAALYTNGPISVLMDADGFPPLQYHSWGIYDPWSCDKTDLNHAVLLVGYGQDGADPYWIVKNSWGKKWANDEGFFKIKRGKGTCGINVIPTSAIV